jgi:hypothetical protein
MAKKQTRRTISVNRSVYDRALEEARRRNITLAYLVELGFAALGMPIEDHPRQSVDRVQASTQARQAHF